MKNFCIVKPVLQIVEEYLLRKEISKEKLARKMGISGQNLGKKLRAKNVSVTLVKGISDATKHNFFEELSQEWQHEQKMMEGPMLNEPLLKYEKPENMENAIRRIVREEITKNTAGQKKKQG